MSKIILLFSGIIIGVYLDQNYKLPNLSKCIKNIQNDIQKYEKPN